MGRRREKDKEDIKDEEGGKRDKGESEWKEYAETKWRREKIKGGRGERGKRIKKIEEKRDNE